MQNKELSKDDIKILICCHKPCKLPQDDIFLPIQVGASISNIDLGIQRDDQINGHFCDNISSKNRSYCELTALYWAWKNIRKLYPNIKYIGLNHYRRYFDICLKQKKTIDSPNQYIINKKKLKKIISRNGNIIAQARLSKYSLSVDYSVNHISEDYYILKNVMKKTKPEYFDSFVNVMEKNNKLNPYNMFILDINTFEAYAEWLFDILFETENNCHIEYYNDNQKRIYGYMGERLTTVYFNEKKKDCLPVKCFLNKNYSVINKMIVSIYCNFLFFVGFKINFFLNKKL